MKKLELVDALRQSVVKGGWQRPSAATLAIVDELCDVYVQSTFEERERIGKWDVTISNMLLSSAWRCAVDAVRRSSEDLVRQGLTILMLEGAQFDYRDSIMRMVVLFHSARKLNLDAVRVFEEAANLAPGSRIAADLRRFLIQAQADPKLSDFSVRAKGVGPSFVYEWNDFSRQSAWSRFWSRFQLRRRRPARRR
jgi:hypothetical protein